MCKQTSKGYFSFPFNPLYPITTLNIFETKLWQLLIHKECNKCTIKMLPNAWKAGPYTGFFCQGGKRDEGPYIFKYEATFILPYIIYLK